MKRALFLIAVVSIFAVACNNTTKTKKETAAKEAVTSCADHISVDSFLVVAENFVGKELTVMGTVDHVCKHGGKRVQMFSSCPSKKIHVEAAEDMGPFKAEVEGSDICVTGIVAEHKMDLAYVEEYEAKIKEAMAKESEEAEMKHAKGADHHASLEKVVKWKEEINASEKGYISTFYLEGLKYQECTEKVEGCEHKHGEGHAEAEAKAPCCADKKVEDKACCGDKKEAEKVEKKPCSHDHGDGHAGHNH